MDKFAFQSEKQSMLFNKSGIIKYIFLGLLPAAVLLACKTENCVSSYNNYLLVGFFKTDTLENGKVEYHETDTVFYSVTAAGNDSVFYGPEDIGSKFAFPVNPAEDFTSFRFEMLDSITYDSIGNPLNYYVNPDPKTLSVAYHRGERIITEDCGIEITFSKLQIEESDFRDTLIHNTLSRFNELNIEVYF